LEDWPDFLMYHTRARFLLVEFTVPARVESPNSQGPRGAIGYCRGPISSMLP
jgi:hypothetical protein